MFKSSLMVCGKPFLCFCVVNHLFVFQIIKFSRFRNWNMLKFAFIKTLPHLYPKKRKNNSKRMFNLQHVHLFWIVFCSFFAFLSGSKLDKKTFFFLTKCRILAFIRIILFTWTLYKSCIFTSVSSLFPSESR